MKHMSVILLVAWLMPLSSVHGMTQIPPDAKIEVEAIFGRAI
jgi:hypothetical protein